MNSHYHYSDVEFENAFETGSFKLEWFNHEAHLRLAWIHIHKYGADQACINICKQIQEYVKKHGASDKYNHTLTIAAVKAVNHFYQKSGKADFKSFIKINQQLLLDFKELMQSHYSMDIFKSEQAQKSYIEPDLSPF